VVTDSSPHTGDAKLADFEVVCPRANDMQGCDGLYGNSLWCESKWKALP
jgi:hypothetical protein